MTNTNQGDDRPGTLGRRGFLTAAAVGVSSTAVLAACSKDKKSASASTGKAKKDNYHMVFVQVQPHTVSKSWGDGIKDVLDVQKNVQFDLLDGQAKTDTQISLMNTAINDKVDAIFLQPNDSVALGPSIKKARAAGIPVLTLNIDATEAHASHVEMNHYFGAIDLAASMGKLMGGKGEVVILNAPPGIIIRDQRTNGFKDGMKKAFPDIKIVDDQNAEWSREKAQTVLNTMLAAHPNITGVYGVNDSMAMGAMDAAKQKGVTNLIIFGNDGEKDALTAIEAGGMAGTQYTDVRQQGRLAAAAALQLATAGISASAADHTGHILMPYTIATKETVGTIKPEQRW